MNPNGPKGFHGGVQVRDKVARLEQAAEARKALAGSLDGRVMTTVVTLVGLAVLCLIPNGIAALTVKALHTLGPLNSFIVVLTIFVFGVGLGAKWYWWSENCRLCHKDERSRTCPGYCGM